MCGPQCQKSPLHIPECHLSRERGSKIQVSKFGEENQMYECITPLRCLWLRDRDCNHWATLMQMESHLEQRRGTEIHDLNQVNVVDFIQRYLNVHSFTDEEVQIVCGIIDVNGFEIPAQAACGIIGSNGLNIHEPNNLATALIGLYGKACLLEHNCVPNTTRTFDAQLNIVIRAAVMITKGSHIATSYTDPMWGTADRQMHLRTTKYFGCECERCNDPTELGTHLSSLRCGQCSGGAVLPSPSPLHPHLWCCVSCQATLPLHQVNAYLKQTGEKLVTLKDNPIVASESYLKSTATRLHENHYYRSDVKLALAQMYGHRGGDGRQQQNLLCDLSKDTLERKECLCREVLALADALCPGESRLRALLLYELQSVWREQHSRLPRKLRNSPQSKTLLQECEGALKVASKVLQREAPLQDEYQLGLQAEAELHELSSLITKLFR
ncbi:hypothetical protein Pcinc_007741 [Petrolisthes cinctipes]|uniref:Protein msta n=1 Tax=Petrolisthes cinctipes TaxID=88211 RepID=A0AAE1G8V4_PETCI|nr:hypothetical protein Pcinc_007741 [Petrolisthes cinctipes]